MATHIVTNLPANTPTLPTMPTAPGSRHASEPPPEHVTGAGPLPSWLDSRQGVERHAVLEARVPH
jgi:hypothetical protein